MSGEPCLWYVLPPHFQSGAKDFAEMLDKLEEILYPVQAGMAQLVNIKRKMSPRAYHEKTAGAWDSTNMQGDFPE